MLEGTLRKYHNRLLDAAAVVRAMIEIKNDMANDDRRAAELGLTEEERAFYDAVASNAGAVYEQAFLRDLIHEVVQTLKKSLKVDWTRPHREEVRAGVRAAVRRVLRNRDVRPEHFEAFVSSIMAQAEALFADWPLAA